jgi:hypothetical protein
MQGDPVSARPGRGTAPRPGCGLVCDRNLPASMPFAQRGIRIRSQAPEVVRGRCENRLVTVAVREPLAAMSSCLDSLRETLGGFDDKGIVQALRDFAHLAVRTAASPWQSATVRVMPGGAGGRSARCRGPVRGRTTRWRPFQPGMGIAHLAVRALLPEWTHRAGLCWRMVKRSSGCGSTPEGTSTKSSICNGDRLAAGTGPSVSDACTSSRNRCPHRR